MMLAIMNLLKERVAIAKVSSDNSDYLIEISIREAEEVITELEQKPNPTKFTKKVKEFIIRRTAVEGVDDMEKFLADYGKYMVEALECIENLTGTINEVIELMDEEPAKEMLKKAVKYE